MDLSNYLFIRTRERMLLENKVGQPGKVYSKGQANKLTFQTTVKSLEAVHNDIRETIP